MSETAYVFWDGDWAKYTMTGGAADYWFDKQNQKILATCYLLADEVITPAGEKIKPPKALNWSLEYPWIDDLNRDWDVMFHIKTETKWQQFCKLLNIIPQYHCDDKLLVADGLK